MSRRAAAKENISLGFGASSAPPRCVGTEKVMANSANVISSDRVEGTTVYNPAGDKLGTIDDLMIDKMSGSVRYAVLEFGGFLGMGTDRYPIPWSMLKYDTSQDGYVVPIDKAMLEGAPRYTDTTVPDYDDPYTTSINRYYGF